MWKMLLRLLKWACRRMTGMTSSRQSAFLDVDYYYGPELSMDDIEKELLQFCGGSIDMKIYDDGIATLCINNYEKRNAISGSMMVDLRRAVGTLEAWREGRGLLLYGAGGTFCSGGDLHMARSAAGPLGPAKGFAMAVYMHHTLERLRRLPLLSAALIEGAGALGGGAEVALACDWRVAAAGTKGIGMVHARMGVTPAWGGGQRLVGLLGRSMALDVLTTAKVYSPEESLKLGLINDILPAVASRDQRATSLNSNGQPSSDLGAEIMSNLDRRHNTRVLTSVSNSETSEHTSQIPNGKICGDQDVKGCHGHQEIPPTAIAGAGAGGGGSSKASRAEESVAVRTALEWLRLRTRHPPEVLRALKGICEAATVSAGNSEDLKADERRIFAPLWGGPAQVEAIDKKVKHC